MKIGIFDSGHGGRYALVLCQSALPQHQFIGFFDHKNAPYGDKKADEVYELTKAGMNNLFDQKCKLVLIACNTASSRGLRRLQESNPGKEILGCLVPAVQSAIERGGRRLGVLATQHTVDTKKYPREAFKVDPLVKTFPLATPKLVPWIEAGQHESDKCRAYLRQHIQILIENQQIDTLILGCTHYHVFKSWAQQQFPTLNIISSAEAQAEKLVDYLARHPELK